MITERDCGCCYQGYGGGIVFLRRCRRHKRMCRNLEQWEIEAIATPARVPRPQAQISGEPARGRPDASGSATPR